MRADDVVAQVDDLQFSLPQRPLFTRWRAQFPAGVTLVQGDEGSGKTTLLRLLAGDVPADAGVMQIAGVRLDVDPSAYRARVFRTDPQSELPQQMSALDWLETVSRLHPGLNRAAVPALIGRLGLREHQDKPLHMLSTGSRRKVWLLAAFACDAPLTLLDQPFAALDKTSVLAVCDLLQETCARPDRAWLIADYEPPPRVALVQTITLD